MLGGDGAASSRERRARLRAGPAGAADRSRLIRRPVVAAGGAGGGTLLSSLETKRLEGGKKVKDNQMTTSIWKHWKWSPKNWRFS